MTDLQIEPSGSGKTKLHLDILAVDDDPRVLLALTDILHLEDHEVTTALDACQALALLRRKRFDLVISDLGMPGMSGLELGAEAGRLYPGLKFVIVTGYGAKITEAERVAAGVIGVMDKPFKINELLQLLQLSV
ncbi:MAG: response regulator [bacterium]|nr:response regulator [bacterium]